MGYNFLLHWFGAGLKRDENELKTTLVSDQRLSLSKNACFQKWAFSVPKFIGPVFAKTSSKRLFSLTENERFGLVLAKTRSITRKTKTTCIKILKIWAQIPRNSCLRQPNTQSHTQTDILYFTPHLMQSSLRVWPFSTHKLSADFSEWVRSMRFFNEHC